MIPDLVERRYLELDYIISKTFSNPFSSSHIAESNIQKSRGKSFRKQRVVDPGGWADRPQRFSGENLFQK
jgi:hypothetical protein